MPGLSLRSVMSVCAGMAMAQAWTPWQPVELGGLGVLKQAAAPAAR